jgi:tRNA-dihydrouridine synthase B
MKLASSELGKVFLAPLSGVADSPFRRICKHFGADVVYSEMISAVGLIRGNPKSTDLLRFHREERPIGIQIFGGEPDNLARAAPMVEESQPDFIDINFSCPARKIVSRGAGCALLRDVGKIGGIASSVVESTGLPVTAKVRIGWDEDSINASEVARALEDAGVAAIAVHGRTWRQGFSGRASWEDVGQVKEAVRIPVILSGDINTPEDAARAFGETGCDAIMIGRGAFGRPWIFRTVKEHLNGVLYVPPGPYEITQLILSHLDLAISDLGERLAVIRFRKHLLWYTKGIPGVVALRPAMSRVTTGSEVAEALARLVGGCAS